MGHAVRPGARGPQQGRLELPETLRGAAGLRVELAVLNGTATSRDEGAATASAANGPRARNGRPPVWRARPAHFASAIVRASSA
jgi:hypothetical protein